MSLLGDNYNTAFKNKVNDGVSLQSISVNAAIESEIIRKLLLYKGIDVELEYCLNFSLEMAREILEKPVRDKLDFERKYYSLQYEKDLRSRLETPLRASQYDYEEELRELNSKPCNNGLMVDTTGKQKFTKEDQTLSKQDIDRIRDQFILSGETTVFSSASHKQYLSSFDQKLSIPVPPPQGFGKCIDEQILDEAFLYTKKEISERRSQISFATGFQVGSVEGKHVIEQEDYDLLQRAKKLMKFDSKTQKIFDWKCNTDVWHCVNSRDVHHMFVLDVLSGDVHLRPRQENESNE